MALIFPNSPQLGDEVVTGGKTWRWDGSRWQNVGVIGYQGSEGYRGSRGETGYQGSVGYQGSQGEIGYTGSQGYTGSKGDIGYTGSVGSTRLRDLTDVDISIQSNGYILTYISDSDKYSILPLEISNQTLDGGDF
jgi:hypothetical protein